MRIAITGALGFIGTAVASLLDGTGSEVTLVDFWDDLLRSYEVSRYPILDSVYRNLAMASHVMTPDEFLVEMRDRIPPDVIVHLGAVVDTMDLGSRSMIDRNVGYVKALVSVMNDGRSTGYVPGIVFASSAAVYGADFSRPNNPYGATKVMGEKAVSCTRGHFASMRFFNVFGAMEHHKGHMASLPFKISQAYLKGDRFDLHSPMCSRDFVPVSSVAQSIVSVASALDEEAAWRNPESQQMRTTYDVGTGKPTTLSDLDNFIMQATGNVSSCVRQVPMPSEMVGRYQFFTCAGTGPQPIPVLGWDRIGTRDGIEEQYGRR